jgi:hypothetical protein
MRNRLLALVLLQAAIWIATLIRFKREGFTPGRDPIVARTADEEGWRPDEGREFLYRLVKAVAR